MIDGVLPRSRDLSANDRFASNCTLADNAAETNIRTTPLFPTHFRRPCQPSSHSLKRRHLMSSFLDQSQLIDLAERLVRAARRAGADAADALAVRSISQSVEVRDG